MSITSIPKASTLCFFILLGIYGCFVNLSDQEAFTLQHAGVQSLVEFQTFELGHTDNPRLKHPGDTFHFEGKLLAAKQPGQFLIGAAVYLPLFVIGVTYDEHFELASSLTTWFSVGVLLSISLICFYSLLTNLWSFSKPSALLTTSVLGFGTILFPYSGVLHHDTLACSFLILSLFFGEKSLSGKSSLHPLLSGFLCGLGVLTSMLAALTAIVLGFRYVVKLTGIRCVFYLLGCLPTLLCLCAYNEFYFHHPFVVANVAGDWSDTFFQFDTFRLLDHLRIYYGMGELSFWTHMPVMILAVLGLILGLVERPGIALLAASVLLLNAMYILNIPTIGHCQFGPRYLIHVVPFVMLGLPIFLDRPSVSLFLSLAKSTFLAALLLLSLVFQTIGSLGGTMYCNIVEFAPFGHLAKASVYGWPELPLMLPGVLLACSASIVLIFKYSSQTFTALSQVIASFGVTKHKHNTKPLAASNTSVFICLLVIFIFYALSNRFFFSPYDYTVRVGEALLRGQLGPYGEPPTWLNEFIPVNGAYYSVFPLGSVLTMLPLSFLQFNGFIEEVPSFFIVSLIAMGVFLLAYQISRRYEIEEEHRLTLSIAVVLGTWMWTNLAFGGSWQLALGFSVLGQLGAIYFAFFAKRPLWSGFFFALAFGNRTEVILTAPIFLFVLSARKQEQQVPIFDRLRPVLLFCLYPFILGVLTLVYNQVRFGSPFDFGYARIPGVLLEPWYRDGIFSFSAIGPNIWQMLFAPWRILEHHPYIVPSGFGGSIFISSPFLIYLFQKRRSANRSRLRLSWLAIILMSTVLFLHGNPGGWQFSYRYAMVLLPWMYLILLEKASPALSFNKASLILFAFLANGYATWLFYWTNYVQP